MGTPTAWALSDVVAAAWCPRSCLGGEEPGAGRTRRRPAASAARSSENPPRPHLAILTTADRQKVSDLAGRCVISIYS